MSKNSLRVKRFMAHKGGATTTEYCIMAAFTATAILGLIGAIGTTIKAESFAQITNTKVALATGKKKERLKLASSRTIDPIQTGSTKQTQPKAKQSASAKMPTQRVANTAPPCTKEHKSGPCTLDLETQAFNGWKGTVLD